MNKPSEIAPNLFFIERGYLNANHFVYRGPDPILIDTGYKPHFPQTQTLISTLGVDLNDIRLIINTHSHCDHIGGNKIIQGMSGCDIAIHSLGKYFSDTRDGWSTWWYYFNQEADFFDGNLALADGDTIAVGPYDFEVIYTPGHAADGIALYHRQSKILISSDALWGQDSPIYVLRVEGSRALFDALASLERLAQLEVSIVYPGHGPPFTDMAAAIDRSTQRLQHYLVDKERLGEDLLKRMMVYYLLMHQPVLDSTFFDRLMQTTWFKESIDFHLSQDYKVIYTQLISNLQQRGIIQSKSGQLFTTVKP